MTLARTLVGTWMCFGVLGCVPLADGPRFAEVIPSSLFAPQCLGTFEAALPDGTPADQAWQSLSADLPATLTYDLQVNTGEATVRALFPDGLTVQADWTTAEQVQVFAVDPAPLAQTSTLDTPDLCPSDEVQARVDVTISTATDTWNATWTVALRDQTLRWKGPVEMPPTPEVLTAIESSFQEAKSRDTQDIEGATFTLVQGNLDRFQFSLSARERSRSTHMAGGHAQRRP